MLHTTSPYAGPCEVGTTMGSSAWVFAIGSVRKDERRIPSGCARKSKARSETTVSNNFDLPKGTFARRGAATTGLLAAGGEGKLTKDGSHGTHTHTHRAALS